MIMLYIPEKGKTSSCQWEKNPSNLLKSFCLIMKMSKFLLTVIRVISPFHPTTYGLCQMFGMVKYYLGKQVVGEFFSTYSQKGRNGQSNLNNVLTKWGQAGPSKKYIYTSKVSFPRVRILFQCLECALWQSWEVRAQEEKAEEFSV